jgi:hypothetical protein
VYRSRHSIYRFDELKDGTFNESIDVFDKVVALDVDVDTLNERSTTVLMMTGEEEMRSLIRETGSDRVAFVLDESEPKMIDPAASAQNIAPESFMRGKVNC